MLPWASIITEPRDAGEFGQQLGMAGIVEAGLVQRLLVERRSDDAADLAGQRERARPFRSPCSAMRPPSAESTPGRISSPFSVGLDEAEVSAVAVHLVLRNCAC